MQAIIFCGIQGSGKSTYYIRHFFNSHIRISMDLLRTRNREKRLLDLCLRTSARFVVDNTNPTAEERQRYILPALAARYEVVGYYFETGIQEALLRNGQRSGRELIPEIGIRATRNKLQLPMAEEGFHRLYHVRALADFHFEEREVTGE
jgi:predicted kinase